MGKHRPKKLPTQEAAKAALHHSEGSHLLLTSVSYKLHLIECISKFQNCFVKWWTLNLGRRGNAVWLWGTGTNHPTLYSFYHAEVGKLKTSFPYRQDLDYKSIFSISTPVRGLKNRHKGRTVFPAASTDATGKQIRGGRNFSAVGFQSPVFSCVWLPSAGLMVMALEFSWLFLCLKGDVFFKSIVPSVNSWRTPCSWGWGSISWQVRRTSNSF